MASKLTKYLTDFSKFNLSRPISDQVRVLELAAVVVTGLGKFIFMDYFNWRLPFVIVAIVLWSVYVWYRYRKDRNILKDWGFRTDNFKVVFKLILPFVLVSVIAFIGIGYMQGTLNPTWHIIPLFITYPVWGTVQQFLTIGLVAGNLSTMTSIRFHKISVILITAVLFSLVHYPSIWLVIGTFILALCYAYWYLKSKNLYVLGLFHGWLGALFYYTVVDQDPFADVFLKYLQ